MYSIVYFFSLLLFCLKNKYKKTDILGIEQIIYFHINFNAKNCFAIRAQPGNKLNSYCKVLLYYKKVC